MRYAFTLAANAGAIADLGFSADFVARAAIVTAHHVALFGLVTRGFPARRSGVAWGNTTVRWWRWGDFRRLHAGRPARISQGHVWWTAGSADSSITRNGWRVFPSVVAETASEGLLAFKPKP